MHHVLLRMSWEAELMPREGTAPCALLLNYCCVCLGSLGQPAFASSLFAVCLAVKLVRASACTNTL